MYRNNIPLVPEEVLGHHLGLTVPPEEKKLFYNPRISKVPPSDSGYGTQIQDPNYSPNIAFKKLNIPLSFKPILASQIVDSADLLAKLKKNENDNIDAACCFNYSVVYSGEYKPYYGHVVVFDKIVDDKIQIVDPWFDNAHWNIISPELMFKAIKAHGDKNFGGIWIFDILKGAKK
jgi:hypothetical protein